MTVQVDQIPAHEVHLGAGISAFFTMAGGGVSPPPWKSLNLGPNVRDEPARVLANRARVSKRLGKPVRFATQVHSNAVTRLESAGAPGEMSIGEADAIVAVSDGFGLGVLVADCVPILLSDPIAGVIGVAHAGRAGLQNGVIANVIKELEAAGASASSLFVAVGPCICAHCYEVPASMAESFATETQISPATSNWGTPALDLRAAADSQLRQNGVGNVTHVPHCTYELDQYFSHRRATRNGQTTGRFAGIIGRTSSRSE